MSVSAKQTKPNKKTQAELLEALTKSNIEMANSIKEMQAEIAKLQVEKRQPLMKLLHKTTNNVTESAVSCDSTILALQKEKEQLKASVTKNLRSLRHFQNEPSDVVFAVEEAYLTCERDIEQAIQSIGQMKEQLESNTVSAAEQIKTATKENAAAKKIKSVLLDLSDRANLIRAGVKDKQADAYRKSAGTIFKMYDAIVKMDKAIYREKLRFKNALHAIKMESFESPHYKTTGLSKKITDFLLKDYRSEHEKAKQYQAEADAIKAFCSKSKTEQEMQESEEHFAEESDYGPSLSR